jgi:hypothetical protein
VWRGTQLRSQPSVQQYHRVWYSFYCRVFSYLLTSGSPLNACNRSRHVILGQRSLMLLFWDEASGVENWTDSGDKSRRSLCKFRNMSLSSSTQSVRLSTGRPRATMAQHYTWNFCPSSMKSSSFIRQSQSGFDDYISARICSIPDLTTWYHQFLNCLAFRASHCFSMDFHRGPNANHCWMGWSSSSAVMRERESEVSWQIENGDKPSKNSSGDFLVPVYYAQAKPRVIFVILVLFRS